MARIANYYSRRSLPSPVGNVFSQLAQSMLNGPDQGTRLLNAEKALAARRENVSTTQLGDLVANTDAPNYGDIARETVMSGYDPQDLGDLFRTITANQRGVNDPRTSAAFVGAGGSFGGTPMGVRENFSNQRTMEGMRQSGANSRNAATISATNSRQAQAIAASMEELKYKLGNELTEVIGDNGPVYVPASDAIGQAPVLSETDQLGALLSQNFDDLGALDPQQQQVLGAAPGSSSAGIQQKFNEAYNLAREQGLSEEQATEYAFTQAGKSGGISVTSTPDGGMEVNVGGAAGSPLTKSTQSSIEQTAIATEPAQEALSRIYDMVGNDPLIIGTPGNIQRGAKGIASQISGVQSLFSDPGVQQALGGASVDEAFTNAQVGLMQAGVTDPAIFSPNLTEIDKLSVAAAYMVAGSLGQRGQGLSDKDFNNIRRVMGDPTAWLANPESFQNGLRQVEALLLANTNAGLKARDPNAPLVQPRIPAANSEGAQDGQWVDLGNGTRVRKKSN